MSSFPEGMANGPSRSEHLNGQIWERPWSLEEIRQHSANWSLAADSGLFLFLQDFSQRMLSKTHEIEKQLDGLIRDTKTTDSRLHSVFNDFLMLSNTQFIENRVYDEEVEETAPKAEAVEKQPEQEKTREQKEAELIPKMQEAVNYGLKVLESAFEHLDIKAGNSDSEDEEATDRVEAILEPKDLYVDRPLPYLIGSQAFMEQDDVGLGDLSSDEMSVDSDRDSVIESEDSKDGIHSDDDFDQEDEEIHINAKKKSSISYEEDDEEEEDEDSDIFGESDKEEDDTKNTGSSSFADELAARIKGEAFSRPEGDRASLASKKKSKGRKESKPAKPQADEDSDDMFKPPRMEDDDLSPFGRKSGLFSGGRGLFDDDDEGDLFSEAPKPAMDEKRAANESIIKSAAPASETHKPDKKIPAGAVSIFPESLFSSGDQSDSEEIKNNENPAAKSIANPKPIPIGAGVGGGLFDEDDEDEDFFSGKNLKKSDSAVLEKPKKAIDLFDDDEDGDIFSDKYNTSTVSQVKKDVVEKEKTPEKKKLPGAVSMFGPGTKNLLSEALKNRRHSTSDESEKNENGPAADAEKDVVQPAQKPQTRGLFSDDEDSQVFPSIPKSQSKPEPTSLSQTSKTPLSLFDDEDEDLFASVAKSKAKANQIEASTSQPSQVVSSSLFSDDEDQWLTSKSDAASSDVKSGGMKTSKSAPHSLPSSRSAHKSSLFDNDDDDDLFAPAKVSSQKKSQRIALLFEDEGDDEDKESLFGSKPATNTNSKALTETHPASSGLPTLSEDTAASDRPAEQQKPSESKPEPTQTLPQHESIESKKKPTGAVSLFGGINVLANQQPKNPLNETDDDDDIFLPKESPPPIVTRDEKKEEKGKANAFSLFDEEEDDDESDWNEQKFPPNKPTVTKTPKPTEERTQNQSTGVFQDEELLFSQTQQKDNDPDVDLFAPSGKSASIKVSSAKPASLFADDDEDDLFSATKSKPPPPKVAEKPIARAPLASPEPVSDIQKPASSPVKAKDSSSRIGKLQASLMINPAALLPGAGSSLSSAPSSSSGVSSSSLSPSPVTTPVGNPAETDRGVNFDSPVQVTTLESAHKNRNKGPQLRRSQSRAARQQAVQRTLEEKKEIQQDNIIRPNLDVSDLEPEEFQPTLPKTALTPTLPSPEPTRLLPSEISPRPSVLPLSKSTNAEKKDPEKNSNVKILHPPDENDLFGSDGLFDVNLVNNKPLSRETAKVNHPIGVKDKSTPSIFDENTDDLFQNTKKTAKKTPAPSFLDEDDENDIFRTGNSSNPTSTSRKELKNNNSFAKRDLFQDEETNVPKISKKHKEKNLDASLFDNVDIFADLTDTFKPKQKSKLKGETKSIFDDDMDDIFSAKTAEKPVGKATQKTKKTPSSQEASSAADISNIFDDPLNALGGK